MTSSSPAYQIKVIFQPLHKEAVRRCSFSFITAKKSVIMSEAFFVDASIYITFSLLVPSFVLCC